MCWPAAGLLIFIASVVTLAIWIYFQYSYKYWARKGVPYLQPTFPKGNNRDILHRSAVFTTESKDWYDAFKNAGHKFGGVWSFSRKVLVVVDPDYIKDVLTKDFQHFVDRDMYSNEKHDPKGTHLFNIEQGGWKSLRQKLTPTFTSGKMKTMFDSVLECSNGMIASMAERAETNDDVDIREVLASFTTDVIGNVAFGVECNSFDESRAEFRKQGKIIFDVSLARAIKLGLARFSPYLSKKLGVKVSNSASQDFFSGVVRSVMDYRKSNRVKRPDFLQLLIDMNAEAPDSDKHVTFDQIVANTILFFIAGFDTSSTTMTFTLYELARNAEIQEKTRREIEMVLQKHGGRITYDALQDMTYLQQVIDEAQRIWPPLLNLGRICTKDYTLRNTNVVIEKGTQVIISPLAMGRDREYFPDPEKFDPERFSPLAKAQRHPYIHIPFGEGPRNCIGLRFGLMQSKIGIIRVLTNFRLKISPFTRMPLTIDPKPFLLKSKEVLYLTAEKI